MVLIKEMLHIDRLKPFLNKQKQSHYTCLILGSKKKKNIRIIFFIFMLVIYIYFINFDLFILLDVILMLKMTTSVIEMSIG